MHGTFHFGFIPLISLRLALKERGRTEGVAPVLPCSAAEQRGRMSGN
jgi:hypothetical protein